MRNVKITFENYYQKISISHYVKTLLKLLSLVIHIWPHGVIPNVVAPNSFVNINNHNTCFSKWNWSPKQNKWTSFWLHLGHPYWVMSFALKHLNDNVIKKKNLKVHYWNPTFKVLHAKCWISPMLNPMGRRK